MNIRPAQESDHEAIWMILEPVIRAGETYALDPQGSASEILCYWFAPPHQVYVAERDRQLVGTFYLQPNQAGGGQHVANCGYVTAPWASGQGVAGAMARASLELARQAGYLAMQFNFVVSTNERAVALWQKLDFVIVGRLPLAFRHPRLGLVDALVMHRFL